MPEENGGWPVVGPSAVPYDKDEPTPIELSEEDIRDLVKSFRVAAERSIESGIKVIELHFAHGYLGCEFLSPLSNQRKDMYGGSFENRARFPLEIVDAVRDSIPESMPLFVRISSTEYVEDGWNVEDSIAFAKQLKEHGVDLIDCSSGGNSPAQQIELSPGYQVPFAQRIRTEANIPTGAVGLITDAKQAEQILIEGKADAVLLARELLRNPYWPLYAEKELDSSAVWASQYARAA